MAGRYQIPRVSRRSGQSDRLQRYLGAVNPPLRNDGGQVVLRTYDGILLDCDRWGDGRCPTYG